MDSADARVRATPTKPLNLPPGPAITALVDQSLDSSGIPLGDCHVRYCNLACSIVVNKRFGVQLYVFERKAARALQNSLRISGTIIQSPLKPIVVVRYYSANAVEIAHSIL